MKEYMDTDHYRDTHQATFGEGRLTNVKRNQNNLSTVAKNKLSDIKKGGFYDESYIKDSVEHWSDPPYAQIKPGYRAAKPRPNFN